MIMFQSKVGKFKFKSNPSLVYTQFFLKVFKGWCLRSKISLCTCHAPTRNEPTRRNRRVPLSGTQILRLHSRVRKANDD